MAPLPPGNSTTTTQGRQGLRPIRNSESKDRVSRGAFSLASGLVSRAGLDCESLRAGIAYGRIGADGQDGSTGVSAEESEEREIARGIRGCSQAVWLGQKQGCRAGFWHGRRLREAREYRNFC